MGKNYTIRGISSVEFKAKANNKELVNCRHASKQNEQHSRRRIPPPPTRPKGAHHRASPQLIPCHQMISQEQIRIYVASYHITSHFITSHHIISKNIRDRSRQLPEWLRQPSRPVWRILTFRIPLFLFPDFEGRSLFCVYLHGCAYVYRSTSDDLVGEMDKWTWESLKRKHMGPFRGQLFKRHANVLDLV